MGYAIIGFGNIGQALAKVFARKGIEVSVATTRDPESFASAAAAIGPTVIPKKLSEAVKADIVFLAVRFEFASGCREGCCRPRPRSSRTWWQESCVSSE